MAGVQRVISRRKCSRWMVEKGLTQGDRGHEGIKGLWQAGSPGGAGGVGMGRLHGIAGRRISDASWLGAGTAGRRVSGASLGECSLLQRFHLLPVEHGTKGR